MEKGNVRINYWKDKKTLLDSFIDIKFNILTSVFGIY